MSVEKERKSPVQGHYIQPQTLNLSNSTGTTTLTFSYFHPVLRLMGMDAKFPKVLSLLWSEIYMMK